MDNCGWSTEEGGGAVAESPVGDNDNDADYDYHDNYHDFNDDSYYKDEDYDDESL